MAKIIAKLENEKFLLEVTNEEIQRLRKLEVQAYITGVEKFNTGYEFPITRSIDSLVQKINNLRSVSLFHNLKREMNIINETIEAIEKINIENK